MGADYSWTSYLGLDEEAAVATFGGRTIGKICGQYDEFFFAADEPPTKSGTVYHKDYGCHHRWQDPAGAGSSAG